MSSSQAPALRRELRLWHLVLFNLSAVVVAIVCVFACSCTKKVLSSVCMSNVSNEVDSLTLMALLDPKLPKGANLSVDFSSDRLVVMYRERRSEVIRRKQGTGTCFDFNPPIQFTEENPKSAISPGALNHRWAVLLSDYWYVVVILTALLLWFFKIPSRRVADSHESADAAEPSLVEGLPELAAEIQQLLITAGETELAAQVSSLKIVDRCRCGDDFCSTFFVEPKPDGAYGAGHRNINLTPQQGMIVLDVVDEKIACVEVQYRDEIRQKLQTLFP